MKINRKHTLGSQNMIHFLSLPWQSVKGRRGLALEG